MLFGLLSKSLLVLVVYFAAPSGAVDQDTTVQLGSYLHKPFGPFYCKARCVALCLESKLAPNVSSCVERFCSNFDENTPCSRYDTTCWLNCGRRLEGDYSAPVPVQGIESKFDQVDGNQDPYTVHITWEPQEGVHLYLLEVFPVKSAFGLNEDKVVQLLTTSNFYMFHKPDLCGVYMARVMAVTGQGWSTPRYKRLNGWTQSLSNVDLHLKLRSMMRTPGDPFPIKVFLEYKKPSTWEEGDAIIADSNVRAFDCNKAIQHDSGFGDTEADTKGFLWPLVFINDSKSEIVLSFPEDVLYPQCKFVYKVLALKTRCGMTTTFDDQDKINEVPFAMNCQNVLNAQCHANQPSRPPEFKRIVEPAQPKDDLNRDLLRPFIFGKPKASKEHAESTPPSPWTAPVVNNDTLWLLFESFLRGFSQGATEGQDNQAKGRKRIMPEAPPDSTTEVPLPPAPIITSESGPDTVDNLTQEFMKAFVESIDGAEDTETAKSDAPSVVPSIAPTVAVPLMSSNKPSKAAPQMPSKLPSSALPSSTPALPKRDFQGVESDIVRVTDRSRVPVVRVTAIDDFGYTMKPVPQVTTLQILSFVALVAIVLVIVIVVLWFISRRSRRKEHVVYTLPA